MWANQTAVVQPRLIPSQLPWGLKHSSSSSGIPILSLWANKIGISSTRSVVTVNCSVISTAYRIFKILSPFDRTMSIKRLYLLGHQLLQLDVTKQRHNMLVYSHLVHAVRTCANNPKLISLL